MSECQTCGAEIRIQIMRGTGFCSQKCQTPLTQSAPKKEKKPR